MTGNEEEREAVRVDVSLSLGGRDEEGLAVDLGSVRMTTARWRGVGEGAAEELKESSARLAASLEIRLASLGLESGLTMASGDGEAIYLHLQAPEGMSEEEAGARAREALDRCGEELGLARAPARAEERMSFGNRPAKVTKRSEEAELADWRAAVAALERGSLAATTEGKAAAPRKRGGM